MAFRAVAVAVACQTPVPVAVRAVALPAEARVVVEPGRVHLCPAQGLGEPVGYLPCAVGADRVSAAVPGGNSFEQQVPLLRVAAVGPGVFAVVAPLVPPGRPPAWRDQLDTARGRPAHRPPRTPHRGEAPTPVITHPTPRPSLLT